MDGQPAAEVRTVGVPTDLLEFRSDRGVVTMAIRKDNGLLASTHTTLRDARGGIVSDALKNYSYSSVGKPLGGEIFRLTTPSGYTKDSLAALAR